MSGELKRDESTRAETDKQCRYIETKTRYLKQASRLDTFYRFKGCKTNFQKQLVHKLSNGPQKILNEI